MHLLLDCDYVRVQSLVRLFYVYVCMCLNVMLCDMLLYVFWMYFIHVMQCFEYVFMY